MRTLAEGLKAEADFCRRRRTEDRGFGSPSIKPYVLPHNCTVVCWYWYVTIDGVTRSDRQPLVRHGRKLLDAPLRHHCAGTMPAAWGEPHAGERFGRGARGAATEWGGRVAARRRCHPPLGLVQLRGEHSSDVANSAERWGTATQQRREILAGAAGGACAARARCGPCGARRDELRSGQVGSGDASFLAKWIATSGRAFDLTDDGGTDAAPRVSLESALNARRVSLSTDDDGNVAVLSAATSAWYKPKATMVVAFKVAMGAAAQGAPTGETDRNVLEHWVVIDPRAGNAMSFHSCGEFEAQWEREPGGEDHVYRAVWPLLARRMARAYTIGSPRGGGPPQQCAAGTVLCQRQRADAGCGAGHEQWSLAPDAFAAEYEPARPRDAKTAWKRVRKSIAPRAPDAFLAGAAMARSRDWGSFDVFALAESCSTPLGAVLHSALTEYDIGARLGIPEPLLRAVGRGVEAAYLTCPVRARRGRSRDRAARDAVCAPQFHNALHGADVLHAVNHVITSCGLAPRLSAVEALAVTIGAAAHDIGHPGQTAQYLIVTGSPLAVMYNDKSVRCALACARRGA